MRSLIKKIVPKWMISIYKDLRYGWIVLLFHCFRLLPIHKQRVVICNVWGYGDNAKYITQELSRRLKKYPKIDLVFITNNPRGAKAPANVKLYKTNSIRAIRALATARVWVDNNRKEGYIRKRKGQYYLQTWHGGIALKKIEKDYAHKLGKKYIANAKKDSAMTDVYISNSKFCTNMYRNSFWYHGPILEYGSPRNDRFFSENQKVYNKIKENLGIKKEKKIAIYAPTYRENGDTTPYAIDFKTLLTTLEKKFGDEFIIAVRLHPLVAEQSEVITYSDSIVNASYYHDIYELMAVGDVLITDYSNIMFEFSFMNKPVFLYAPDVDEYERERGFYFNYTELPYTKAKTRDELLSSIIEYEQDNYIETISEFYNKLGLSESGRASELVVDHILSIIKENHKNM